VHSGVRGDLEYLRILHLAASTIEADVEVALELLLVEKRPVTVQAVKVLVSGAAPTEIPDLAPEPIDLAAYDVLLQGVGA
jgi:hypothetical protein